MNTIKYDNVVFGPFIGEFGWELTRWAPMINMFKRRNPNTNVCIATDKDSFGLYLDVDHQFAVSVPDGTRDGFNNTSVTDVVLKHLEDDIRSVFPGYDFISPSDFDPVLNVFSWEDRYCYFPINHEIEDKFRKLCGNKIPIAISSRHIEGKDRNWPIDNWLKFYDLINDSDKYIGIVVGKSPTIIKADERTNIIYAEDYIANESMITIMIAALRICMLTVGQQSSVPILSQFVETPTLMFGHRKYRNMNFDNPMNVRKMFIDSPNYNLDPLKLYEYMDNFVLKLER